MVEIFICILIFALLFSAFQGLAMIKMETTPYKEAITKLKDAKDNRYIRDFAARKQIQLKKLGADVFLKDQITVSQWYIYKFMWSVAFAFVTIFLSKVFTGEVAFVVVFLIGVAGFFFMDLYLRMRNKSSNEEMMTDIMEMSRSVLYGKRGGQYITDALKDSVMVVENKRLKLALIRLSNNLDSGMSIDECLQELELSFSSGEISAFCTVIKSLQSTGQVDESLKVLENNIEREQVSVNKRRCVILENKTMMYVMMVAFDILGLILYCVIMKLLDMQIAF
ncbi:MAG: type II secretion system F family protein [Lachnospiraceae bacterium]|nr:type II secretion system F family protein [Lachnospiraceae bacterium]